MAGKTTVKKMGRPPKSERDDASIKFDRTLAAKAKLIAQRKGRPLAEYLTELSRPIIDRDYRALVRELDATTEGSRQ